MSASHNNVPQSPPSSPTHSKMEQLELEAVGQRNQIHRTVEELKSQVSQVRHNLEPEELARKNFTSAALGAGFLAFVLGYGFGGFFTD